MDMQKYGISECITEYVSPTSKLKLSPVSSIIKVDDQRKLEVTGGPSFLDTKSFRLLGLFLFVRWGGFEIQGV